MVCLAATRTESNRNHAGGLDPPPRRYDLVNLVTFLLAHARQSRSTEHRSVSAALEPHEPRFMESGISQKRRRAAHFGIDIGIRFA